MSHATSNESAKLEIHSLRAINQKIAKVKDKPHKILSKIEKHYLNGKI
jgi:hypothetical protein